MILRHIKADPVFYPWIGKNGAELENLETVTVPDEYRATDAVQKAIDDGWIEVVSYDSTDQSFAMQGELAAAAAAEVTYENLDTNGDVGVVASTVAAGDDSRFPTTDQKAALAGTGTPGAGDLYVNDSDSRMTDARTPVSHNNTYHSETYITSAGVTYENLDANSDVGQASSTVAAGDDNRFATANEKAALAGTGTPGAGDLYVNDSDSRMTDARTPTSHDNTYHSVTFIAAAGVTYENLDANSDVGAVASTVAAGDDSRFPTTIC
jgi:hypothetical protein